MARHRGFTSPTISVVLVALLCRCVLSQSNDKIVEIPGLGSLMGTIGQTARSGRMFTQFLGIRYANVTERFKEAVPADSWEGVKEATTYGPRCVQFTVDWSSGDVHWAAKSDLTILGDEQPDESEDCLVLDVYTPKVETEDKLPVLIFIHGGSFIGGGSSNVQPGYLLEHDIILVAPQYRLGPLGFLCLHTDDAPGNAGLSDMLLAVRWVRDYIEFFGGDPTRVTLAGNSAGAAGAGLLQLSPLSYQEGGALFQQLLQMSGTVISPFAIDDKPRLHSLTLAAAAGCNHTLGDNGVVKCLRNVDHDTLRNAFIKNAVVDLLTGGAGLGGSMPVVQQVGALKVIGQPPLELLQAESFHAMPYLTGVTKHEGIFLTQVVELSLKLMKVLTPGQFCCDKTMENLIIRLLMTDYNKVIADALVDKYFKPGSMDSTEGIRKGLIDFTGALYFKGPAQTNVRYNSIAGFRSYLYTFNHQDNLNAEGVSHASDFNYVFPSKAVYLTPEENDVSMKIVELFANFVIDGVPSADKVPEWRAYTTEENAYLAIDYPCELRHNFETEFTAASDHGLRRSTAPAASDASTLLASVLMAAVGLTLR